MNVVDRIREGAEAFARNPAVIEVDRVWTHGELFDRVDRLSEALKSLGVSRGEVVMAWLPDAREAIECELAVLQMGAVWVTLNQRMTWLEVQGVIATCEPKVFITDAGGVARAGEGGGDGLNGIQLVVIDDRSERDRDSRSSTAEGGCVTQSEAVAATGALRYEDFIAGHKPIKPKLAIGEEEVARLRYTSGTTGEAKAAVLSHRVYLASLENLVHELHRLGPEDRVAHFAPLTHASGALIYPILAAGGANVVVDRFDAERALELIEAERVTTMFVVPTILQRLTAAPSFSERDLSSLKTVMYGGAPIAADKLAPAIERFGRALVHIYGMTEAPYPIATLAREEQRIGNPRLNSIGKPTTICELQVRREDGSAADVDEVGEIWIRGRNVMSGYWKDEAATREVLREGWLASGDLGRCDAEGFYYIVDRKKDVIISGGFNVYAAEVELALCEHESIAEAAVVGTPHPDWGETVLAFVVAESGHSIEASDLDEWCRKRLSAYKIPKRIEILDELPKNSSGKIQKSELAHRARQRGIQKAPG